MDVGAQRAWCFTLFGDNEPAPTDGVRYACWQREICPDTGNQHFQGYAEFARPTRRARAIAELRIAGAHLEPRMGTRDEARNYTRKPETAVPGTWREHGAWHAGGQGRRSDVADAAAAVQNGHGLKRLAEELPVAFVKYSRGLQALRYTLASEAASVWRDLRVLTLVGASGTGKTRWATETFPAAFLVTPSEPEWWDGYDGEETLIIDELRDESRWGLGRFLRILDGYQLRLPTKGGFTWALWKRVIITTNQAPEDWYGGASCAEGSPLHRRLFGAGRTVVREFAGPQSIPGEWAPIAVE